MPSTIVMLSVVPMYANKIFDGTKKIEFRKRIWTKADVRKVIVYSSSPVKQVVGEFDIDRIVIDDKEVIWEMFKDDPYLGTEREAFDFYIREGTCAAIVIGNVFPYETPKTLEDFDVFAPPQSFTYLKDGISVLDKLEEF